MPQDHTAAKKWSWTAEDNERLKAFVAKNVSILKAAAALKRSTVSVRNQARRLGTPFPSMKEKITAQLAYVVGAVLSLRLVTEAKK
jgi:hypothetical protein